MTAITKQTSPKRRFWQQRQQARGRNIEWKLTFEEWWAIWQQSGKWEYRGCKKGQYCMSRKGDIGPYATDNVFIQLHSNNISDANKGKSTGPISEKRLSTIRPGGLRPNLTKEQVDEIINDFNNTKPFPYGTKMKWLNKKATQYNITVSLADKITNGRCAKWYS
jgi:hypothetical protein